VEDNELIRGVAVEMLSQEGHSLFEAGDAEAAFNILETQTVDCMVVDRGLPGVSGDELARQALARWPALKVVFATGEAMAVPDAAFAGAAYVIKPYTQADLVRAIVASFSSADASVS
jgi:CheY-like chemotaxis protein